LYLTDYVRHEQSADLYLYCSKTHVQTSATTIMTYFWNHIIHKCRFENRSHLYSHYTQLDNWSSIFNRGREFLSFPCPNWLCGPPSLYPMGTQIYFPRGKAARAWT